MHGAACGVAALAVRARGDPAGLGRGSAQAPGPCTNPNHCQGARAPAAQSPPAGRAPAPSRPPRTQARPAPAPPCRPSASPARARAAQASSAAAVGPAQETAHLLRRFPGLKGARQGWPYGHYMQPSLSVTVTGRCELKAPRAPRQRTLRSSAKESMLRPRLPRPLRFRLGSLAGSLHGAPASYRWGALTQ